MIAEWGKLRAVGMHKPGLEVMFGLLDPSSFLYERRFNWSKAKREHDNLRRTLKEEGVKIYRLRQTIANRIRRDSKFREKVIGKVGVNSDDPEFLVELLILRPILGYEKREKGVHLEVKLTDPLSNLYFMRDQQITTEKGIIMGRMTTHQREKEIEVMKLFWEALNMEYREIGRGKLEGGDFFPMGDFSLIGVGVRSNLEGVSELFNVLNGEIGVVYWNREEFIHLDTFFNVGSSSSVVSVRSFMEESRVVIYYDGKVIRETTLYDYVIKEKGFSLIEVSVGEAKNYVTNFLTIDDGKVLSPKNSANRKLEKEYDVIEVEVSNLTGGAGGIHCMTAVIERN
ncbi:MAG: arginine deiminase family protein [Saccharolobus sp.]|uniref:arginine deiminase family protein n=1 Tax=Saccharolobus TaxID=2100760 RepID=UPI001F0F03B9|nr:arginine deiminase family protein [Saccharolobus shibatae]MCH4816033.1 arginine deiminase family protein [Saccharolobus shibatae]